MTKNQKGILKYIPEVVALLGLVIFLVGLAQFGYAGTFSRYWADDYCYSAVVNQQGLIQGEVFWYNTSGNRVSTLVAVSLSELFGQKAIQWIPIAILILWIGATMFFFYELIRTLGWKIKGFVWTGLLSVITVYFAIYLAPDRMQSFYWRMGTLHYSLPLPLLLITLGLLSACWRRTKMNGWLIALSGLLSFFAAGLSETFAAMQTGLLLMVILALVIFWRGAKRARAVWLLIAPLLGSIAMMIVMMLSPSNAARQASLPPPDPLWQIIPVSLRYAADFVFLSLRGRWLPYLVFCVVGSLIGMLAIDREQIQLSIRHSVVGFGVALLGAYALVVCSFAPSALGGLQYPVGRALMPGAFALLAGLFGAAFFAGRILWRLIPVHRGVLARMTFLVILVGACLYPIQARGIAQNEIQQLSVRAGRWDARNAQILDAVAAHENEVLVKQTDIVKGMGDLGPDSTDWINRCAAVYYGIGSITANP